MGARSGGELLVLAFFPLVGILVVPYARGEASSESSGPLLTFEKHVIDGAFANGYQVSSADVDSDGDPDVIALSTSPSQLVWYRNPDWAKFTISTRTQRNIDCAPLDVDGDGDWDLAVASEFDLGNSREGGTVQWLECPPDPAAQQEWAIHPIDAIPTSHRVRWADIDGDGIPELINLPIIGVGAVAPEYAAGVQFRAYRIPGRPASEPWPQIQLDDSLNVAHGLCVVPGGVGEGARLLTASFDGIYHHTSSAEKWTKVRIGVGHDGSRPKRGSSEAGMGRLTASATPFIATIEPWHGNEVVVYVRPASGETPWPRTVIDDSLVDGHGLVCLDIDGDSVDEIVAGGRGGAHALLLFDWDQASESWRRHVIDPGDIALAGIIAADLNDDGNTDLIATGTSTHNVVWYENLRGR